MNPFPGMQARAATGPRVLQGFLLLTLVIAAFSPALSNGYVWDDHIFFDVYPADVYVASWWANGREPFAISSNYFRPLGMLSFLVDFAAGPSAAISHLLNLSIHALNAVLVGFLAWRLLRIRGATTSWIAVLAGLWYGLHPALIESAAMVMCRFDLMATTWSLLLLHVSLATARWVWPVIAAIYLGALLSKESAAGLLAAWPFWVTALAWLRGSPVRAIAKPLAAGWAALGAGLLLDLIARYGARGYVWAPGSSDLTAGAHLELFAMSMAQQIRLMVLPYGAVDPFHTVASFSPASYLVALAVVAAACIAMARLPCRGWAALILAGIAALAPTSNAIPISFSGGIYTADRFLTLPLVFVAPAVAAALQWAWERSRPTRQLAAVGLAAWLVAAVVLIRVTLPLLQTDARFWAWIVSRHPEVEMAQNNLADALILEGRLPEAIEVLGRALETGADNAALWHNLARAYRDAGQLPLAMEAIDRALAIDSANEHFWNTKATLMAGMGDLDSAERIIRERVLAANPALIEAHLNLIRLLLATGRPAEAESYMRSQREVLVGAWGKRAEELIQSRGQIPAR